MTDPRPFITRHHGPTDAEIELQIAARLALGFNLEDLVVVTPGPFVTNIERHVDYAVNYKIKE